MWKLDCVGDLPLELCDSSRKSDALAIGFPMRLTVVFRLLIKRGVHNLLRTPPRTHACSGAAPYCRFQCDSSDSIRDLRFCKASPSLCGTANNKNQ